MEGYKLQVKNYDGKDVEFHTSRLYNELESGDLLTLDYTLLWFNQSKLFKSRLLSFTRPKGNSFYKICDARGFKNLTRIRVSFSDLRDHRYNHNFNCLFT